jgi:predicted DNA-binding transcriptional regulator AlpA
MTKFWDVEQLAEHLGLSETWIYNRTRKNGPEIIPHLKLGKYVRFNPESEAFQAWLRNHDIGPEKGDVVGEKVNDQHSESR